MTRTLHLAGPEVELKKARLVEVREGEGGGAKTIILVAGGERYALTVDRKLLESLTDGGSAASRAAPDSSGAERIAKIPKSKAEAIEMVRSWKPDEQGSTEEAVRDYLRARNVLLPEKIFDKGWDAERRKGGGWIVTFSFLAAGQTRTGEWVIDDAKREVRTANEVASEFFASVSKPRTLRRHGGRRRR